jgi:fructosamine-3-kinase
MFCHVSPNWLLIRLKCHWVQDGWEVIVPSTNLQFVLWYTEIWKWCLVTVSCTYLQGIVKERVSCVVTMADTSSYLVEEQLIIASMWAHKRPCMGQTIAQVMTVFHEWFNKVPPWKVTVLDLKKRVFSLGSVKDSPQSGWRKMYLTMYAAISALVSHSARNQHGSDQQSLMCHHQQSKITWRKTWIWSHAAQSSQVNCWTLAWIATKGQPVCKADNLTPICEPTV